MFGTAVISGLRAVAAAAGLILCGALASPALAVPFAFTYTTTIQVTSGPAIPGVNNGDVLTLEVVADNGNASTLSQSWFQTDVLSAVATVGSYTATFIFPFYVNDPVFATNGAGDLILTVWYDIDGNNFDNVAPGSPTFYDNVLLTSQSTRLEFQTGGPMNPANWSVTAAQVPEPGALALFGIGLAGLGVIRRRLHARRDATP